MVFCVRLDSRLSLSACDTPYTGFLGAGDIDKYVERTGKETVCLADGLTLFASGRSQDYRAKMAKMAEMAKTVNLLSVREASAVPRVNPEGTGRLCIWNWKRLSLK